MRYININMALSFTRLTFPIKKYKQENVCNKFNLLQTSCIATVYIDKVIFEIQILKKIMLQTFGCLTLALKLHFLFNQVTIYWILLQKITNLKFLSNFVIERFFQCHYSTALISPLKLASPHSINVANFPLKVSFTPLH